MDTLTSVLLIVGPGLAAIAIIWFFVVMVRTHWLWLFGFFLVIPQFVFIFLHWRRLKGPGLLLAGAMCAYFAALILDGDLFRDRHPNEPSRTRWQRALGCSGSAVWSDLMASQTKPLEDWVSTFRLDPDAGKTESSASVMSVFASALAYLSPDRLTAIASRDAAFPRTIAISAEPYQAVVVANDRLVIVAFRGTDNAKNWKQNFKAVPSTTEFGRVHAGFLEGYKALSPQIMKAVTSVRNQDQAVWLTGHSLGGAMAVLAAPDLQAMTKRVEGVVTFGQPPVGYRAFAEAWEAKFPNRLVRYINHTDAVVEVVGPLALPSTALTHTGQVRYFDTTGTLHTRGVPTLQVMRDAVCAPMFESGAEFGAHYIRRYLTLVLSAAKQEDSETRAEP